MTAPTTLALMQPYLFPYLGSFALIAATDAYVVFDNVQYIRRGWMHRNRIHKPGGGWQYVGVPIVRAPRETLIRDIAVSETTDWRSRLLGMLDTAYGHHAPHHAETRALIERAIGPPTSSLAELNIRTLALVCEFIGLPFRPRTATELALEKPAEPHGWAIGACRVLGASRYVNPPGGADLYPAGAFHEHGLELGILRPRLEPYARADFGWEPGLSVLDALMFLKPAEVLAHVQRFDVEWRTP